MHPNPIFRKETGERNLEFARQRAFGVLAVNADNGPLLSHIPFRISDDGKELEAHLVRSNPILSLLDKPVEAVIAVNGPDTYISPDWYDVEDQVPTWNYVAVHLRGTLTRLPQEDLHGVLERLSESLETRLAPKKPWTHEKMDQQVYERMQRQIVPVHISIGQIDGTWKLSQNKPDTTRLGAADGAEQAGLGQETAAISTLMRSV